MYRDNSIYLTPVNALGPAVIGADTTSATIDLQGFDAAMIELAIGVGGITFDTNNKIELKITHSDDDTTYVAVGSTDVILGTGADAAVGTGGIVLSLIAAHAAASVAKIGYVGFKRFIKVFADFSGTHGTGTPIAVQVIKGLAHQKGFM